MASHIGAATVQIKSSRELAAAKSESAVAIENARAEAKQEAEKVSALENKAKILNSESAALRKRLTAQTLATT